MDESGQIADVFGSAFSSFAKGFGSGLGNGIGGGNSKGAAILQAPAPVGFSRSDQVSSVGIDFSGWTVSTGSSKANGATTGMNLPPWLIFGVAALAAVILIRTRKR